MNPASSPDNSLDSIVTTQCSSRVRSTIVSASGNLLTYVATLCYIHRQVTGTAISSGFRAHANFSLFFVHLSSNCLRVNMLTAFEIFSHRHAWMVLKSLNQRLMMFRRVVFFFLAFIPSFSLSLFRRHFPFNLVLCHWW